MSDNINKFNSKKIYKIGSPKLNIVSAYFENYINEVTNYPKLIKPNPSDFYADYYIEKLFLKYNKAENIHNEIADDILIKLKKLEAHFCLLNNKPFDTMSLDYLKRDLMDTYKIMVETANEIQTYKNLINGHYPNKI